MLHAHTLQSHHILDIKTSVLFVNNRPHMVTLDYTMDVSSIFQDNQEEHGWVFKLPSISFFFSKYHYSKN